MFEWVNPVGNLLIIITTLCTAVWWLSTQFTRILNFVSEKIDKLEETILSKLEYHERHDDQRFNAVTNDLWTIKVRNASRDNLAKELIDDIAAIKNSQ